MKWRVATKEDLIDMGRKFWRDIDKSNMSPGLAYTMFHKGISIEVLDESTPAEDWVKVDSGVMPDYMESVLITTTLGTVLESQYTGSGAEFQSGEFTHIATHWRNLPSPPKK